jgi:hypothetical protein
MSRLTRRRAAFLPALLLGAAALGAAALGAAALVACGATAGATPTAAPASVARLEPPLGSVPTFALPDFSFALPSFEADPALEAMFPDTIGGQAVEVASVTGTSFMSGASGTALAPVLQELDATAADLSVAFGGTAQVTVIAFQLRGVSAEQFFAAYTSTAPGAEGAAITDTSFGGKAVKKVVPVGGDTVYLYLHGEVMWTVGGASATDALLTETFSKLP